MRTLNMKKTIIAMTLASVALAAAPVLADPPPWAPAHGRRAHEMETYDRYGHYTDPRPLTRTDHVWRGHDGRYYCRRDNGTTGLIIGGAAGALLGHSLAGSGDRTLGALLGGAGGALIGREIDRGSLRCQ
jgi:hypothetical protein